MFHVKQKTAEEQPFKKTTPLPFVDVGCERERYGWANALVYKIAYCDFIALLFFEITIR